MTKPVSITGLDGRSIDGDTAANAACQVVLRDGVVVALLEFEAGYSDAFGDLDAAVDQLMATGSIRVVRVWDRDVAWLRPWSIELTDLVMAEMKLPPDI